MGTPIRNWVGINWASDTYATRQEAFDAAMRRRDRNRKFGVTGNDARVEVSENRDGTFTHRYHL